MAPKKVIPKPKVTNALVSIKKSKRLEATKSNENGRHYDEAQPAEISKENTDECEIPQLNDDCLLEIFSYLPMSDLMCRVAVCCHQFNALAERTAQQKCQKTKIFHTLDYEPYLYDDIYYEKVREFNERQHWDTRFASIVERFGGFLQDVTVFASQWSREANPDHSLTWLNHCTSLKSLDLHNMTLNVDQDCVKNLQKLEQLTLMNCYPQDNLMHKFEILLACENLRSITIGIGSPINRNDDMVCALVLYVNQLVNLEKITIKAMYSDFDGNKIATKLAQMNNLKFLSFDGNISYAAPFIDTLSVSQSLEELNLSVNLDNCKVRNKFEVNFDGLVAGMDQFPNLKICGIHFEWVTEFNEDAKKNVRYGASYIKRHVKNYDVVEGDLLSVLSEIDEDFLKNTYSVILSRKN